MKATSAGDITLVHSRKGPASLQMAGENGLSRALHSLYDPEKEARALADRFSFEGRGQIVVLGLGLGYHVVELARRFPDTRLVVVEASEEIHALAREYGILEGLSDQITFLVGLPPAEALREITRLQLRSGLEPAYVFPLSGAVAAFGEYYEPIRAALAKAATVDLGDRLRYRKFEREAARVLVIDFDYFLTREVERAIGFAGHEVRTIRVSKGDRGERIVSRLIERILEFRPDFLLTVNHLGFDQDGVLTSFLDSIEMPAASWYVDSPNLIVKEFKANVSPYTAVFLWDRGYLRDMESMGFESVTYLPLATDETIFRPLAAPGTNAGDSACDVGFVGNSMVVPTRERMARIDPELHPLVERLAEQGLTRRASFTDRLQELPERDLPRIAVLAPSARVDFEAAVLWRTTQRYRLRCVEKLAPFGPRIHGDPGWKRLLKNGCRLSPPLHYYRELPLFYNRCRVNFNATSLQMGAAVNQRVFDVPACGSFLLTDHQEALEEAFDVGKEVIAFEDPEEIPDLVRFYLRNPGKRQAVADRGHARVLKEHTYRHRLNRILETMKGRYGR